MYLQQPSIVIIYNPALKKIYLSCLINTDDLPYNPATLPLFIAPLSLSFMPPTPFSYHTPYILDMRWVIKMLLVNKIKLIYAILNFMVLMQSKLCLFPIQLHAFVQQLFFTESFLFTVDVFNTHFVCPFLDQFNYRAMEGTLRDKGVRGKGMVRLYFNPLDTLNYQKLKIYWSMFSRVVEKKHFCV
jgi:hypothetical protein